MTQADCTDLKLIIFLKEKTRRNMVFRLQGLNRNFYSLASLVKVLWYACYSSVFSLSFGFAFVTIFRLWASFFRSQKPGGMQRRPVFFLNLMDTPDLHWCLMFRCPQGLYRKSSRVQSAEGFYGI